MTFNFKENKKYKYYFDASFSAHKVFKPFLLIKKAYILTFFVVISMLGIVHFVNARANERRELSSLKTFIVEYAKINNIKGLTALDYEQLSKEIKKASKKYDVDPILVLSVITVESSFNKHAVSPKGAVGLMQLMPSTAKALCDEKGFSNCSFNEVETNILLGTYYLSKLSAKYNNNVKHYLTAYNYGPYHVDRVIKEKSQVPASYYYKVMRIYQRLANTNV